MCTCVECIGIVGVYMRGVPMYMCGVHRDCGCVDVWSA